MSEGMKGGSQPPGDATCEDDKGSPSSLKSCLAIPPIGGVLVL